MSTKTDEINVIKQELSRSFAMGARVSRSTVAVIDTVVQRGGFKGEELSTIGQLRDLAVQYIQLAEANAAESANAEPDKK